MASQVLAKAAQEYAKEVASHLGNPSATEETYYPPIRNLLAAILSDRVLPFRVVTGTSELRAKGVDRPDVALYETGDFAAVLGEVKTPDRSIKDMAVSTDRKDQIGRYLAQTGVVLLCNVRTFGLLACKAGYVRKSGTPVPPGSRELRQAVGPQMWLRKRAAPSRPKTPTPWLT